MTLRARADFVYIDHVTDAGKGIATNRKCNAPPAMRWRKKWRRFDIAFVIHLHNE
jgi:hypothetical protein